MTTHRLLQTLLHTTTQEASMIKDFDLFHNKCAVSVFTHKIYVAISYNEFTQTGLKFSTHDEVSYTGKWL